MVDHPTHYGIQLAFSASHSDSISGGLPGVARLQVDDAVRDDALHHPPIEVGAARDG